MRPLVSNGTAHRHDLNEDLFLGRLLEVKTAMGSLDPRSQAQHARPQCIAHRHTYSLACPPAQSIWPELIVNYLTIPAVYHQLPRIDTNGWPLKDAFKVVVGDAGTVMRYSSDRINATWMSLTRNCFFVLLNKTTKCKPACAWWQSTANGPLQVLTSRPTGTRTGRWDFPLIAAPYTCLVPHFLSGRYSGENVTVGRERKSVLTVSLDVYEPPKGVVQRKS